MNDITPIVLCVKPERMSCFTCRPYCSKPSLQGGQPNSMEKFKYIPVHFPVQFHFPSTIKFRNSSTFQYISKSENSCRTNIPVHSSTFPCEKNRRLKHVLVLIQGHIRITWHWQNYCMKMGSRLVKTDGQYLTVPKNFKFFQTNFYH